jgi:hypothetical protein
MFERIDANAKNEIYKRTGRGKQIRHILHPSSLHCDQNEINGSPEVYTAFCQERSAPDGVLKPALLPVLYHRIEGRDLLPAEHFSQY